MYSTGDRVVIVNLPESRHDWRNEITIGSFATVVRESSYSNGLYLLLFDEDIGGHNEGGGRGKQCWNVNGRHFTLLELSPEEQALHEEQKKKDTEKRVLAKIKYLDKRFEEGQRRKQYAKDKAVALQNGVTQRQSITIDLAGWPSTTTRSSLSSNQNIW